MSDFIDYYALLQISPKATTEEIEQAFRALARKYHPDVNPDPQAKEMFQRLVEAREVLTDPKRRLVYDRQWRQHYGMQKQEPPEKEAVPPTPRVQPVTTKETGPSERLQTTPFQKFFWDAQVIYSRSGLIAGEAPQRLYALTRWRPPLARNESRNVSHPLYNLIVVDTSRSMQGQNLFLLMHILQGLASLWEERDYQGLISFADHAHLVLAPAPGQAEALIRTLIEVRARGATEFLPPLQMALDLIQRVPWGYVPWILFVTDGRAYDQERVQKEIFPQLQQFEGVLDVIGLGHAWDERFLESLAAVTGGALYYVRTIQEGQHLLGKRMQQLRRAYIWNARLEWEEAGACVVRALVRRAPEIAWYDPAAGVARLGPLAPGEFWELLWEWEWLSASPANQEAPLVQGRVQTSNVYGEQQHYDFVLSRPLLPRESLPVTSPAASLVQAVQRLTWHRLQAKMRDAAREGHTYRAYRYLKFLHRRAREAGEYDLARTLEQQKRTLEQAHRFSLEAEKALYHQTRRLMLPTLYRKPSEEP